MNKQKQFIIKKATELFNLYGFKSVTMDDISSEAGISKKTLYLHFNSKHDLIDSLMQESKQQTEGIVHGIQAKKINCIERFYSIYKYITDMSNETNTVTYWSFKKYYPESFESIQDFIGELLIETCGRIIFEGIKKGYFIPEIIPGVFNYFLCSSLLNIPEKTLISNMELDHYTFQKDLIYYALRSIATTEGLIILSQIVRD